MTEIIADGGCMCGAVRYSLKGELLWAGHCHCESCRRQTSSPVTSYFCVYEKDMMFSGNNIATYESSVGVTRGFCKKCGSPVSYATDKRPEEINLFAITLDDPSRFKPWEHVFWGDRVDWLNVEDNLKKHVEDI